MFSELGAAGSERLREHPIPLATKPRLDRVFSLRVPGESGTQEARVQLPILSLAKACISPGLRTPAFRGFEEALLLFVNNAAGISRAIALL